MNSKQLAATLLVTFSAASLFAQMAMGDKNPHPVASNVYVNPRSGPDDPRVGLKGGLYDAGTAASGMKLLITLPKPPGFAPDLDTIKAYDAAPTPPPEPPPTPGAPRAPRGPRGPQANYGGTNSDLAMSGSHLFVGNYNGINTYDITNPAQIKLISSLVCPGGQGDVSVYGHLMFMSVEAANGRMDCGTQGFPAPPPPPEDAAGAAPRGRQQPPASPDRVKGVRIFDISDVTNPRQVADVQTCRGSHTHTLVVDPKDKDNIYVYVSGSAGVRPKDELGGCTGGAAGEDPDTALFTIVVIKVPLAHPEQAKVVNSPRIFADPATGKVNGLMNAPIHGEGESKATTGCHDITIRADLGLAAGACSGNGILLDITDPVHPKRLDAVNDPNYSFWHSANFSNDGTKVLFTDEWGGGSQAKCRAEDPMNWGADAIFDITPQKKLVLQSYYKMPAPQTDTENCVAHNGSMIPVPGRDIEVQSWYQGGVSVFDWTDPTHPFEIAYFDRGPIDATGKFSMGGQWSTYWYNGYIYGSEIARGVDVFDLTPSKFLSQHEIDAAKEVQVKELNVQNQDKFIFPQTFTVAQAYLDQLTRDQALPAKQLAEISEAITKGEVNPKESGKLKSLAAELDKEATKAPAVEAFRMQGIAKILRAPQLTASNGAKPSPAGE
jgi:hypothetical protein